MPARFLYHVLKSAGQPHLLPRVYMLKSVLLFPYLEEHVLKSASPPLPPEFTLLKKCVALPLVIRRPVLQSAGIS